MLNGTNELNTAIVSNLDAMRRTVAVVLGAHSPAVEDVANDAVVRLLSGAAEQWDGRCSFKSFCTIVARNLAKNYRALHANAKPHASANVTDYDRDDAKEAAEAGEDASGGPIIAGEDGRDTVERRLNAEALRSAVEALEEPLRTFATALAEGDSIGDAGRKAGWSAPTATRKRKELIERLAKQLG